MRNLRDQIGGIICVAMVLHAVPAQAQMFRGEILPERIIVGSVPRIIVDVNKINCVPCAQGVQATLEREPAIDYVHVFADSGPQTGRIQITLKANQNISDARLFDLIRAYGYRPLSSRREGGA